MRGRAIGWVLALAAAASLFVPSAAHASGGFSGSGSATSGCAGGQIVIEAVNINGSQWMFDVTALCLDQLPQHVWLAGAWNAPSGGPVTGIGTGSLNIGPVSCSGASNTAITIVMIGANPISGTFSTHYRLCA